MDRQADHPLGAGVTQAVAAGHSRHRLWVLALVVAMFVAAFAGAALTRFVTRPPTNSYGATAPTRDRVSSPVSATQEYLEAMKVNDRARAYAVVCATRHADPFGSGTADPMLGQYRNLLEISNDGAIATTTATLTFEPGAVQSGDMAVRFTITNESAGWHVCGVDRVGP